MATYPNMLDHTAFTSPFLPGLPHFPDRVPSAVLFHLPPHGPLGNTDPVWTFSFLEGPHEEDNPPKGTLPGMQRRELDVLLVGCLTATFLVNSTLMKLESLLT